MRAFSPPPPPLSPECRGLRLKPELGAARPLGADQARKTEIRDFAAQSIAESNRRGGTRTLRITMLRARPQLRGRPPNATSVKSRGSRQAHQ